MIRYRLACERGHEFEAWFASSAAYDEQENKGLLSCALCGSSKVGKMLMAPAVAKPAEDRAAPSPPPSVPAAGRQRFAANKMPPEMLKLMREIREHVRQNSEYVGDRFAEEARRIHYDEAEDRGIFGEATMAEARDLHEEGIAVHPLPPLPDDAN